MRLSAHRHIVRANTWLCSAETFLRCCWIPRNTSAMNQALVITLGVVHLLLLGLLDVEAQQAGDCGGLQVGTSGSFKSPNYPDDYPVSRVCVWIVNVEPGEKVVLTFESFSLEESTICKYDYVLIRDGGSSSSAEVGKYCGNNKPATITSSGSSLWVDFRSDSSTTKSGFQVHWRTEGFRTSPTTLPTTKRETTPATKPTTEKPVCGGYLSGDSGSFTSPEYPDKYPSDKKCVWIISVSRGKTIELSFEDFQTENDGSCKYDYVEVRNGLRIQDPLVGKYCGTANIPLIRSSGSSLFIKFTSDKSVSKKGFKASWKSNGPSATPRETSTPTPKPTEAACGGNYSQVSGVVQSPNYPKNYPTDAFCQWTIKVSEGYKIRLEFIDLDVERDTSCRYDYILVLDGPLSKPTELGKFCGNSTNTVGGYVDSMSNIMTVMFKSDMNKVRRGFEAYWFAQKLSFTPPTRPTEEPVTPSEGTGQIEGCGATISAPSGDIYSPNFPNKYNSNLDCIWILEVSQDKISIGFNEFELEDYAFCQADYLEIRDGDSESSPLLGRFCGSNGPMIQYGTTNKLWVKFHTDGKIQKTGFEATWTKMKQTHMFPSEKVVDEESKPYPSPSRKCNEALGLEDGMIKDSQLTASSVWMGISTFGPQRARLNSNKWPQGWSTSIKDQNPWLKVNLGSNHVITAIATQGYGNAIFNEWVESYYISWLDKMAGDVMYEEEGNVKLFEGNRDRETVVRHVLKHPFVTGEVVFRPKSWHGNIGLRIELYGCKLGECMEPLGLTSGLIKDEQLKASSAWSEDQGKFGAQRARLNLTEWPQGWTANVEDKAPWLQVDLRDDIVITQVGTQGHGGTVDQWVKSYWMSWENDEGQWLNYSVPHRHRNSAVNWKTKVFHGNKDRDSIARHTLRNPIKSKMVRFWPLTKNNFVSMRAELYGCQAEKSSAQTKCEKAGKSLRGESRPRSKRQCEWLISSPARDGTVILKFDLFDFPKTDSPCSKDYVEVRNGQTEQAPVIGRFCGSKPPQPIQSSGNALWVRYVASGQLKTEVRLSYTEGARRSHQSGHLLDSDKCGVRNNSLPRPGQWPWQIALLLMGQSFQQCGGALIAPQWMLTGAHCFRRFKQPSQWVIRAGEWDLHKYDGTEQDAGAKAIYIHSGYNSSTNENDIALVYLQQPFDINEKVGPICLSTEVDVQAGRMCMVTGWGSAARLHFSSASLFSAQLPIVSRQQCNAASAYGGLVTENMVCAGFKRGGRDSCHGDGGGPLMCQNTQGKWTLVGVSSWGEGCGLPNKYGVYTNIAYHQDWITRQMQEA